MGKTVFIFFLTIYAQVILAEGYTFSGTFPGQKGLAKKVDYHLSWNEKDGKVFGNYRDNYFSPLVNLQGVSGELGRILIVSLSKETHGVRTLTFLMNNLQGEKGNLLIPVSASLRDDKGNPVYTFSSEGTLAGVQGSSNLLQAEEERKCGESFGALKGFCGIYKGMLTEDSDPAKKCELLTIKDTSFVLDEKGEVGLVLGEASSIVNPPVHRVGRVMNNPATTKVDILSRSCRNLYGTKFSSNDCKRLNINGEFSIENKQKHFTGIYSITDEKTNQKCQYTLSMNLES